MVDGFLIAIFLLLIIVLKVIILLMGGLSKSPSLCTYYNCLRGPLWVLSDAVEGLELCWRVWELLIVIGGVTG